MTNNIYYHKEIVEAEQYDGTQDTLLGYKVNKGTTPYILTEEGNESPTNPKFFYLEEGEWLYKEDGVIKQPIGNDEFMEKYRLLPLVPKYIFEFIKNKRDLNTEIGVTGVGDLANIFVDAKEYGYPNVKVSRYITKNPNTFAKACIIGCAVKI